MFFLSRKEAMYQVPVSIATLVNRMPCHEKGGRRGSVIIFSSICFCGGNRARDTTSLSPPQKRQKTYLSSFPVRTSVLYLGQLVGHLPQRLTR